LVTQAYESYLGNLKQFFCKAAESNLTVVHFNKPYGIFVDSSEKAVSGILTKLDAKK